MDSSARSRTHRLRTLVVAVTMITTGLLGVASHLPTPVDAAVEVSAGGYYTSYNPCPWARPYQRCNAYGDCFCSQYP